MTVSEPTPAPLTPDQVTAIRGRHVLRILPGGKTMCDHGNSASWPCDARDLLDAHDALALDLSNAIRERDHAHIESAALTTALAEARAEVEAWHRVHAEDQEIARARRDEARVAAVEAVLDRWRDDPNIRLQTTTYASIQAYLRAALTQPQGDR